MSLRGVLGDCEVARQLDSLVFARRLPHAVVLEGSDIPKCKTAARELAKACVCSCDGKRPCGECSNCKKADEGIHPDIYTVKILDKKQAVGVGEIRTMISDCYIKPNEADCKVYFIFDKMTVEAQNALLKILEEPPKNVQFVICTESSSSLLQTVLSRSAVFKLDESSDTAGDEETERIAVEIAEAIPKNMELPLLIATGKLVNDKALALRVLDRLTEILNVALEAKYISGGDVPPYVDEIVKTLRKRSIVKLIEVVTQARTMLLQNCNMNLLVTWLCANIRRSRHTQ